MPEDDAHDNGRAVLDRERQRLVASLRQLADYFDTAESDSRLAEVMTLLQGPAGELFRVARLVTRRQFGDG